MMMDSVSLPAQIVFVLVSLGAAIQFALTVGEAPAFAFGVLVGGVVGAVVWAGIVELVTRALTGLWRRLRGTVNDTSP